MAGILNTTARIYHLKVLTPSKRMMTVRLAPGVNQVTPEALKAIEADAYCKVLIEDGVLKTGAKVNALVGDQVEAPEKVSVIPLGLKDPNEGDL